MQKLCNGLFPYIYCKNDHLDELNPQKHWLVSLRHECGLQCIPHPDAVPQDIVLKWENNELSLLPQAKLGLGKTLQLNYRAGKLGYRLARDKHSNPELARAIGIKATEPLHVIDLTAGLGRDAMTIATLGCQVTMVERNIMLYAMVKDALRRLSQHDGSAAALCQRIHIQNQDSQDYLQNLEPEEAQAVTFYMDPMYPHRNKSALVKKEMRIIRMLVGDDEDSGNVLSLAIAAKPKRVVVKRPAEAPPLDHHKPSFDIKSKNTRYDVYLS